MLSLTALFDIFVKIDADNIRLVVIGAVELNGPDPEWRLIFDLFSRDKQTFMIAKASALLATVRRDILLYIFE